MKGLSFAWAGLRMAYSSETSMKIHVVATILVTIAGWFFDISPIEWILIIGCIGFVITTELLNTAIEYLVDMVSPGFSPTAGKVKDIAAGAVLISAITSLVTGLIVFFPKVVIMFGSY